MCFLFKEISTLCGGKSFKYGPKENNNIDEKNFKFTYNFKTHEEENVKEGIFCEECEKITSGLFLWFPSCGHEEHLIHINKNKSEYYCNDCKKKNWVEN